MNTDLPIRAPDLVHLAAHEAYPGHHLEHAWKEADLVERRGRLEASVLMINTPECLLSEGLADLGHEIVSPAATEPDLLVELFRRAGLPIAEDPVASREAAERAVALAAAAAPAPGVAGQRLADAPRRRRSHDEVLRWLIEVGPVRTRCRGQAARVHRASALAAYVFVYHEGEALLRTLARGGAAGRPAGPVRSPAARAALAERDRRRGRGRALGRPRGARSYGFLTDTVIGALSSRYA